MTGVALWVFVMVFPQEIVGRSFGPFTYDQCVAVERYFREDKPRMTLARGKCFPIATVKVPTER